MYLYLGGNNAGVVESRYHNLNLLPSLGDGLRHRKARRGGIHSLTGGTLCANQRHRCHQQQNRQ